MHRYKGFGSFVAWYVGPCDEIAKLRKVFRKRLHWWEGGNTQPWMYRTSAAVHNVVKEAYPDRDELSRALLKAKAVFNSAAHASQVEQRNGWHSRH